MKALIVIDMQNDFCPKGALAVNDGDKIIPIINELMSKFDKVIATQDWHPVNHVSFASTHNKNPFTDTIEVNETIQALWPDHCIQETLGADFHKDLEQRYFNLVLKKGTNVKLDSYSTFLENDKKTKTGLVGYLNEFNIKDIYLCGLATDYCVYFSAIDCKVIGFNTYVILDATKGVNVPKDNIKNTIKDMNLKGIQIINTNSL